MAKADVTTPENIKRRTALFVRLRAWRDEQTRLQEEAERRRKAAERAVARTQAAAEIERLTGTLDPVASRQNRLADADRILSLAMASNLFSTAEAGRFAAAINARKRWIVGEIRNGCGEPLVVAGTRIAPGAVSEPFVFTNGLPHPWSAHREGFAALKLPVVFDGQTVALREGDFAPLPVSVRVPAVVPGVSGAVNGEAVAGAAVALMPGTTNTLVWRRADYIPQTFRVTVSIGQKDAVLPAPSQTWTPSAGLRVLMQAEAAADEADWAKVKTLLPQASVTASAHTIRRTALEKRLNDWVQGEKRRAEAERQEEERRAEAGRKERERRARIKELSRTIDDYSHPGGELWADLIKTYYELHGLNYALSDEDRARLEQAWAGFCNDRVGKIRRAKREVSLGNMTMFDLDALEKDFRTIKELYDKLMRR